MQEPAHNEKSTATLRREILRVVAELAEDLDPSRVEVDELTEATELEAELGLDSLARLELASRLESRLDGRVGAAQTVLADTVGDLFDLAETGRDHGIRPASRVMVDRRDLRHASAPSPQAGPIRSVPQILRRLAERDAGFVAVRLIDETGAEQALRAGELLEASRRVAAGLEWQIAPSEPVAMMLPGGGDFLAAFFGVQLAGGIPVPLAPAARPSQIEDQLRRQVGILDDCGARRLIVDERGALAARFLRGRARRLEQVVTVRGLSTPRPALVRWRSREDDAALLQYTSGSTGAPKGVVLTHRNLLSNLDAIAAALDTGPGDVFVSWLPLHHDMGLIGGVLHPLHRGIPLVLLSPLAFLSRPLGWLEVIDRFGGTLTVAPNFAYELCQRRALEPGAPRLDLGSLRLALNGAEPVSASTLARFVERFEPMGLSRRALVPVYGLAENTLAVTFATPGVEPVVDRVRRDDLVLRGRARPADATDADALELVSCGRPLDGVEVRVADAAGRQLPERWVGRVLFRGDSASPGYYGDSDGDPRGAGDWVDSGDLGYLADGALHLTGRSDDQIVQAGRNLSPHTIEEAAGDVAGVRKGGVVAFGLSDRERGTERLVLVAEVRRAGGESSRRLEETLRRAVRRATGVVPDEIHFVAPRSLLKTSSGKIRRSACRRLFLEGRLDARSRRSPRLQLAAVAARASLGGLVAACRDLPGLAYSAWAWLLAAPALACAWFAALLLPTQSSRHAGVRFVCRLFFAAIGVPIRRRGAPALPNGAIVVSNHASYLDGMLLLATLPGPLTFVVKRAFARSRITRWLMHRLGTVLVDPSGREDVESDLARMAVPIERGEMLVVFAEGTFGPAAGLRPFRLGAFALAARAGRPIVPVAIVGSRFVLRDEQWRFRRRSIEIVVGEPLEAPSANLAGAADLRERARTFVLARTGEPDLAHRSPELDANRHVRSEPLPAEEVG